MDEKLIILESYAMSFLGVPYLYGGRNRLEGLDCSQLVIEILTAGGLFHHTYDTNAQGLLASTQAAGKRGVSGLGAIAFYGRDEAHVSHVAWCLSDDLMIEAGGGDATTVTMSEAIRRGACVRIRPIKYRKDFLCVVMPTY